MTVTLLLETLTSGQIAASILEFPHWRVEAETRESAISQLQATFLDRLKHVEAVAWDVLLPTLEPTWMPFAGTFRDDPDFAAIMDAIRHERDTGDDSEVDPAYYE
ncbi:MAG: hypothetical protein HC929_13560 [Leptolyngbyaceae cyanobacterium SM2_5_2]|nr:hypothetical protein [Leptolyngbyaceae cyanobacterium SM2_5_2]